VAAVAILSLVIPGRSEVEPTSSGSGGDERAYKVNGVSVCVVALAGYYGAAWQGVFSPALVYRLLPSLLSTATAWTLLAASLLYIRGEVCPRKRDRARSSEIKRESSTDAASRRAQTAGCCVASCSVARADRWCWAST